jgi:hypothetical protein
MASRRETPPYEPYAKRDAKIAAVETADADMFAATRDEVRTSYVAPARRTGESPDAALAVAACELLGSGHWPRELPALLGVPPARWRRWLEQGTGDLARELDTPEAALSAAVERARARLERGYRGAVERLASNRAGWQAAVWLLQHLSPGRYSDKAAELVDAEVRRLLEVAQGALRGHAGAFEALVLALEGARDGAAPGDV